jgi:JmjC domain, hydroxylase
VWYVLPNEGEVGRVVAAFRGTEGAHAAQLLATKNVGAPRLSAEALVALGARRVVQHPGDIVLTAPGTAFHWTMATGFCVAESCNFMPHVPRGKHVAEVNTWLATARRGCAGAPAAVRKAMRERERLERTLRGFFVDVNIR